MPRQDDPATFHVEGISLGQEFYKYSFIKRRNQEIRYGKLLAKRITDFSPDLVMSGGVPPEPQSILLNACHGSGSKFVFWVQDIYSLAISRILRNKLPLLGWVIGKYYELSEQRLLKKSEATVLITQDFLPLMNKWGVNGDSTYVIPNWATLDEIPCHPKSNAWSRQHGLDDKFCIMYSGTLGLKHNPELLLALAENFKDNEKLKIVVISEGLGVEWLEQKKQERNITNLILMNYQQHTQMPEVLSSADVLIALLSRDAGVYSVPSKVLTYLCIGRPLLLALPSENLASKLVLENLAGIVVSPDDTRGLVNSVKKLLKDEKLRSSMGQAARAYAERTFDINRITGEFENIFACIMKK